MQVEESVEIEKNLPSSNQQVATHYTKNQHSSTLPTRGKTRERSKSAVMDAFSSVRGRKGQKKRSAVTDDTFLNVNSERSESSGYLSQHSSYNSLLDQESTGSMGSQEGKFQSHSSLVNGLHPPSSNLQKSVSENNSFAPQGQSDGSITQDASLSQPQTLSNGKLSNSGKGPTSLDNKKMSASQGSLNSGEENGENGRPKILNRTRSSSRADKDSKRELRQLDHERGQQIASLSSRKTSEPLPVTGNSTSPPTVRKESLPVQLSPPVVSPGASPEIRRRAESITQQLILQNSPDLSAQQKRRSGVFQFPDPLEILNSALYPNFSSSLSQPQPLTSKKSIDDLSPDDFPPVDPQLVNQATQNSLYQNVPSLMQPQSSSPQRQRLSTSTSVPRRCAPSPPSKLKGGGSNGAPSSPVFKPKSGVTNLDLSPPASKPRSSLPATSVAPNPPTVSPKPRGSLPEVMPGTQASPPSRRYSTHGSDDSPRTPKRKAPPPPQNEKNFERQGSKTSSSEEEVVRQHVGGSVTKDTAFRRQRSNEAKQQQQPKSPSQPQPQSKSQSQPQSKSQSQSQSQTKNSGIFQTQSSVSSLDDKTPTNTPTHNRSEFSPVNQNKTKAQTQIPVHNQSHFQQVRKRTESSGDASGSTRSSRLASAGESDKIAEMLRAKAQQRKQKKEEDRRKKNTNQILKSSGVETNITDERSDLLRAIRKGIELKNVKKEQERKRKQSAAMPWDVAAILERRQALETHSDNENDEGAVHEAEWDEM